MDFYATSYNTYLAVVILMRYLMTEMTCQLFWDIKSSISSGVISFDNVAKLSDCPLKI